MTEAEWLACRKPWRLIRVLGKRFAGRKQQLFLTGVGQQVSEHLPPSARVLVDLQQRFADGEFDTADYRERLAAADGEYTRALVENNSPIESVEAAGHNLVTAILSYHPQNTLRAALEWGEWIVVLATPEWLRPQVGSDFQTGCCNLLRELFPAPGREYIIQPTFAGGGLLLPDGSTFHVPEVARSLALGVQQDQAFDRLPIVADALEDANCADRPLLDHLRHGTNHRRGCWALDLVLGRG